MIYKGEPIQILWNMVKALKTKIPIYKEVMFEEKENIPQSYILLRSQSSDSNQNFGDGVGLIRSADCDIILVTKGFCNDTSDLHYKNRKLIRDHLKSQDITFYESNLGYSDVNLSTEHDFGLEINYIG